MYVCMYGYVCMCVCTYVCMYVPCGCFLDVGNSSVDDLGIQMIGQRLYQTTLDGSLDACMYVCMYVCYSMYVVCIYVCMCKYVLKTFELNVLLMYV